MTRKKSNVKALALAVMYTILAGGALVLNRCMPRMRCTKKLVAM